MSASGAERNFKKALQILGIEEYQTAIETSNSKGEMFHLEQYFSLAELAEQNEGFAAYFKVWFENAVTWAKDNWERPESVYQHIGALLLETSKENS